MVPPELHGAADGLPVVVRLAVAPVLPVGVAQHHRGHQVCVVLKHLAQTKYFSVRSNIFITRYLLCHGVSELDPLGVGLGQRLGLVVERHLLVVKPELVPGEGDGAEHGQHALGLAPAQALVRQVVGVDPQLVRRLLDGVVERLVIETAALTCSPRRK